MQPCRNSFGAKNRWRLSALTLASTLVFSNPTTFAQSSSVSVSTANNPMDPVIVTATRTPTRANDVLADYVFIGPEEIADAGQTSLVELLQRQRGVEITGASGSGGAGASVFLRGTSNQQSLLLIDGVRVEAGFLGGPTWSAIPLAIIDRIEIIFGPQSSLYGSDAIGGVIQIFTKTGEGPFQASASTGYGTYGTTISEAGIFGRAGKDNQVKYSLSATQEVSSGFNLIATNMPFRSTYNTTQNMGYTRDGGTGKLSLEFSRGQELGIQFFASRLKSQASATPSQLAESIGSTSSFAIFSNNQITNVWKGYIQVSQSYDSGQNLFYNSLYNTKQNIYTWQNDIQVGEDTLQLLAERRSQNVFSDDLNYNSSWPLPREQFSQTRNTNSLAGLYQLKRGAHLANASFRNDNITGYGSQNTGGISYGYFFTKQLRANINYGTGFRAPTFNDLYYPGYGNSNIQAEKSKNTEAGIHYESIKFDARLIAYTNTITNLIQGSGSINTSQCSPGFGSSGCAINIGEAKITGLSIGGAFRSGNISFRGSFDQQNPVDESSGSVLPKRAKQFGNAGIDYKLRNLKSGIEGTFVGRRFDSYPAGAAMGGYALFNVFADYEFAKDWSIFGRWNNIFNKDYQLSYGYNTPGSNLFVGVRYAMK
ncbi:TonB-dependent receptor domain-containing protein [Polynucleobacter sp. HIN6]|uniref:TonB-dependent receptor domain-containing protein n=1 Tax=Polynucleobacter sp. HIN6 TaxID=3047865 RepID=UPI002572AF71|nr:TonB-dependent receptor [Polynucleobacter sp. HIN6]